MDELHDPAFIIDLARRTLARTPLRPGEEATVIDLGRMLPDDTFETSHFTVDAEGTVYLTRDAERTVYARARARAD